MLWAYQTIARTLTGETPFRLVFGTKDMIPVEVGLSRLRQTHYDEALNTKAKPRLPTRSQRRGSSKNGSIPVKDVEVSDKQTFY